MWVVFVEPIVLNLNPKLGDFVVQVVDTGLLGGRHAAQERLRVSMSRIDISPFRAVSVRGFST
jgi:hypothetical protein